uniref:Uncharacterized protein n=1 Tax=Rhizophora mucronata TaxID=61149 RepID=A0A2P2NUP2_RHIMU
MSFHDQSKVSVCFCLLGCFCFCSWRGNRNWVRSSKFCREI